MRVLQTIADTRSALRSLPRPLALVPTMGYLHEGHLSLVRRARAENASVAVSIFVNPAQFGPNEDFATYPRDPDRDHALLEREGVELVFEPSVEEMYPAGFDTAVEVGAVSHPLEGAARPGHFRGVATVVAKLFNIVQPDRAYFGQKDAQQVVVLRRMVADLAFPLELVVAPIVREPDGLALSSRNVYLSPQERTAALALSRSLREAERLYASGERQADRIRSAMEAILAEQPLVRVGYVSIADPLTLQECDRVDGPSLVSLAAYVGRTRLIDNTILDG